MWAARGVIRSHEVSQLRIWQSGTNPGAHDGEHETDKVNCSGACQTEHMVLVRFDSSANAKMKWSERHSRFCCRNRGSKCQEHSQSLKLCLVSTSAKRIIRP